MKRLLSLLIAITVLGVMYTPTYAKAEETAEELVNSAPSAILMEKNSGMTLYEKQADKKLPPASMTKIMTLLLIMEELEKSNISLDEKVRVSENAASMGGSQIFLEAGEEMTVKDLIKGIAIASGNDASVAMAERIAGSEKAFVKLMNEKAKSLGLKNTHFENPTGLPAKGHYSTARDMAVMARELLLHEDITEYTSTYEDYLRKGQENEFWLVNTNKLIKSYPGVDGLKTGYTDKAKYCLTASAKKGDLHMIAVVMGAETPKKRNADVTSMLDYGFSQYEGVQLFSKNDVLHSLKTTRGTPKVLPLAPEKDVVVLKKKNQPKGKYKATLKVRKSLDLPVKKGDHFGWIVITNNGQEVTKVRLEATKPVKRANILELFERSFRNLTSFQKF
ncbi:D-alanyl-D-alanine carboxypeptidase family protein [Halobacillus naozhouensis]|uniref:serine-type D-Ala-D-Ala carboxypeptidase n=1 Tax=Halobacillus naozhouensis TaxID=554880 RepID=A0ABY8IVD4_9BACI|nr:D-alanyl-D-alanine carboxypeptidase family protein [Halobacillus naozhouensis]WFT73163.1 D-alanyl-D-alanine carboxypeptidase [Halobacillus naozhouensis]